MTQDDLALRIAGLRPGETPFLSSAGICRKGGSMSGLEEISPPKCATLNRYNGTCMFLWVLRVSKTATQVSCRLLGAKTEHRG